MPERAEKMTKSFSVFDCDGHINEPVAIWRDYVEPEYRDAVRRTYWRDEQQTIINGRTDVRAGVRDKRGLPYHEGTVGGPGINKKLIRRFQNMQLTEEQKEDLDHKGAHDPHARLKDMDVMGIDQAVIIPTQLVNTALYCEDLTGLRGLYRAYNNWAADYCSVAPERLFGAGMLPLQNPVYCIDELQRLAKKGYKVALVRPVDVKGRYPNRIYPGATGGAVTMDEVFRTFQETGLVLGIHALTSTRLEPSPNMVSPGDLISEMSSQTDRPLGGSFNGVFSLCFEAMVWVTQILLSGFLDRYPALKMAVFESNCTWLPTLLTRCDRLFRLYRNERATTARRLPSEAFYDQCFIAVETDEVAAFRQWDRFENIGVWSSDVYHFDGADAWSAMREMWAEKVPSGVQQKLLGANSRRMYGIAGKLFVTEEHEVRVPDWFPKQDAEFDKWWNGVAYPRRHAARAAKPR